jgi:hypothetical protein
MANHHSDSCPFRTFSSAGDAYDFVRRNWGQEGARCSCR